MSAHEAHTHLVSLHCERALARDAGLDHCAAYMTDLNREIATWRSAHVIAAVTEIATFRARLSGPQVG